MSDRQRRADEPISRAALEAYLEIALKNEVGQRTDITIPPITLARLAAMALNAAED